MSFIIGKVQQEVRIIIEITRPSYVGVSHTLPHIAVDNIRMVECLPEPPVFNGECQNGQLKCKIMNVSIILFIFSFTVLPAYSKIGRGSVRFRLSRFWMILLHRIRIRERNRGNEHSLNIILPRTWGSNPPSSHLQ